jgi:ribA/ribD-fused uncharacterized protein
MKITGGPLLNFYTRTFMVPHPITGEYVEVPTVEHYFQACKGLYLKNAKAKHQHYTSVQAALDAQRPHDAKRLGRTFEIWLPLWNRAAFGHMLTGQLAKFTHNPDLARMLRDTGDVTLVEHRPDPVWGDNLDGTGKNLCGRSLMMIRSMTKDWNIDE